MSTLTIISLITFYANMYNIDPAVAVSVAEQESQFNALAKGEAGEIGIFQIKSEYVAEYTKKQLFDPEINIKVGIIKLAEMKKSCPHKRDLEWLTCYNFGIKNAKKLKHPGLFKYVKDIKKRVANYDKNL